MWKQNIYNYLSTVWKTVRQFLEDEPQYAVQCPQIYRMTYIFIIYKCNDGYVVTAYPSGFADNYIYNIVNRSVKETLNTSPNKIIGTENHVIIDLDGFGGTKSGISGHFDTVTLSSGISIPTMGYKFFYVMTLDYDWAISDAKKEAYETIELIKSSANSFNVNSNQLIKSYEHFLRGHRIATILSDTLRDYRSIIDDKSSTEREIHVFLRNHPLFLIPTKRRLEYEYPLYENTKKKYVIDFVAEITSQRYVLIELENPKHRVFKKGDALRDNVNHAKEQIVDWMNHIRAYPIEVEKDFPGISQINLEAWVIIGRGNKFTPEQKLKLRRHNENSAIKIMTYDDLAEEVSNHLLQLANLG